MFCFSVLVFSMCWKFRHMMASQVHKLPYEKNSIMNNFQSFLFNEQNNYFSENVKHELNNHTWSNVFFGLIFLIILPVISCTTLLSKIGKLPRPRCARTQSWKFCSASVRAWSKFRRKRFLRDPRWPFQRPTILVEFGQNSVL
jgi:hypothetical protein